MVIVPTIIAGTERGDYGSIYTHVGFSPLVYRYLEIKRYSSSFLSQEKRHKLLMLLSADHKVFLESIIDSKKEYQKQNKKNKKTKTKTTTKKKNKKKKNERERERERALVSECVIETDVLLGCISICAQTCLCDHS